MLPEYDTVIISDVHLGSRVSNCELLLSLLKKIKFKRLIILGDMFADLNFSRLKSDHWNVLSYLRRLSNVKTGVEVVWVYGNHDIGLVEVLSHLVGIEVFDKYEWIADNKRCIALHGHQFDPAISKWQVISDFFSWWYLQLQKLPWLKKGFPRWVDYITTKFQNLSSTVENRAFKYAKLHSYDVICCGHTHEAMHSSIDGVDYYNSGCWVKNEGSYIAFLGANIEVIKVGDGN
jgi:UDP-2,3-diacylglucosamine pyrophosphatase LpxH